MSVADSGISNPEVAGSTPVVGFVFVLFVLLHEGERGRGHAAKRKFL